MLIPINVSHAFNAGSHPRENAYALRALLDCMVNINRAYLRDYPETPTLYRSRVVYGRTLWWEPIPAILQRGKGDCKSLAPWLIAEYLEQGHEARPVFRFNPRSDGSGHLDFHILVLTPWGFEDPSKKKGMGKNENARWVKLFT